MKLFKNIKNALLSRVGAYIFLALSTLALIFLRSATWTYGWVAELYPLGENFIPTVCIISGIAIAVSFAYLLLKAFSNGKKVRGMTVFNIIYIIFAVLGTALFFYSLVLVFGLDSGFSSENISRGINACADKTLYLALALFLPLAPLVCDKPKKAAKSLIAGVLIIAIILVPTVALKNVSVGWNGDKLPALSLSENLVKNAKITFESLKKGEKPDAVNLLEDNNKCWTPSDPARSPEEGHQDCNNSYAEIQLAKTETFNTAVIEEIGNQVQYFRLQALVNDEWITVYESEKIEESRLCSFDAVTTDRIRLSVDKFRSSDTPAKIRSIKLYNEPVRAVNNFEVTGYQRLDGDVPTAVLAKGEEYVKNYAKYYDVYTTVIVFAAVNWTEDGNMTFSEGGEEAFARELTALKEIISHRENKEHEVKVIVTALADGARSDGGGVNVFMAEHWETVADKIAAFAEKYSLDGVDIDWEYPQTGEDWRNFDKFIARLDAGLHKYNPDAIISAALSAWALGMSQETLDRIDQIQFMAYDGNDTDGYQSSLQQAQEGLQTFKDNGADISKINIGIAAYGRPVNGSPYWATWRDLKEATYWNSMYGYVHDGGQVYAGTFCAPALAGDKAALALFSGAGGVMVFRIDCDKTMDNPNAVARGIQNALNRYAEKW